MNKREKLNGPKIKFYLLDEKGKRILFKEKKRDPNEVVKVIVMPDGDICLFRKEFYDSVVASTLSFQAKPQIKEMTWEEYMKKQDEMEMKRIKWLSKILIRKIKGEKLALKKLKKGKKIIFGAACCS